MSDTARTAITLAELRARRAEILALAERCGAYNVRVFGSVARGDSTPASDADLLVCFRPGASLFELSTLRQELAELLEREVNVISEGGLRERFRERLARDVVDL